MAITTTDELRTRLQWAIEIEHSIIPPYLCALYSIKPGRNVEAVEALTSVFIEEMLHMTLAANVLNAIGGAPVLDRPDFLPKYPTFLPHSRGSFEIPLTRFSKSAIATFMRIENPEGADAVAEADQIRHAGTVLSRDRTGSRGPLCGARRSGDLLRQSRAPDHQRLDGLHRQRTAHRGPRPCVGARGDQRNRGTGRGAHAEGSVGRRSRHVPPGVRRSRALLPLPGADARALYQRGDTPGSGPSGREFTIDWDAAFPMRDNPRSGDYPAGSPVREKMDAFNRLYSDMLRDLHRAFNGEPKRMFVICRDMRELKTKAVELMQTPSGDGVTTAGLSFEWMPAAKPVATSTTEAGFKITVEKDGPYLVEGGVPLARKSIVYSEWHEPMSWRKDADLGVKARYRLCRCGQSKHKPYCDNTHAKAGFDGTETAPVEPTVTRQERVEATRIAVMDDEALCTGAGFCGNRVDEDLEGTGPGGRFHGAVRHHSTR